MSAPARHPCSAAQLVAICVLALGLATFLAVLHSLRTPLRIEPPCEFPDRWCSGEDGTVDWTSLLAPWSSPPPPPPRPPLRPLKLIIISDWHTHPDYSSHVRPGWPCFCSNSSLGTLSCPRQQPANSYGQIGCDSPEILTSASLEAAAADIPDPDLVIVLGDLVWHESVGRASTQDIFHHVSEVIANAFPSRPRACTVPLGNNDVYPGYHVNNSNRWEYAWQAAVARKYCGIDSETADHFARHGYYSFRLESHSVLILVLNTNLYHPGNCPDGVATPSCGEDPLGQFAWIGAQMGAAEEQGFKVQIHGHIPPALDPYRRTAAWVPAYISRYWGLVERHAGVLSGHFFGHWHRAEVRLAPNLNASGAARPRSLQAPALQVLGAISPIYSSNPVFYSATFDAATYLLQPGRFKQYVLNLSDCNTAEEHPRFVASTRAVPPDGLTNEGYRAAIESWLGPQGEAAFAAFYAQRKNYHAPDERSCDSVSDTFDKCLTCTGGCRVAYACYSSHGTASEDFAACVAANS